MADGFDIPIEEALASDTTDLGKIPYNAQRPMTGSTDTAAVDPGIGKGVSTPEDLPFSPNGFSVPAEQVHLSPIELGKFNPDNTYSPGNSELDGKPILDTQNVDDHIRWQTQLFFDRADEKADFIKQEMPGYLVDVDPTDKTNVIVKRKGSRYWGRVDPGEKDSILQEIAENADGIAQFFGVSAGPLAGAAVSGGIEGVRQFLKTQISEKAKFDTTSVGIATGAGLVSGIPQGIAKFGAKKAADVAETSMSKGVLARMKRGVAFLDSPQYKAQEWGANAAEFGNFGKDSIEKNFSYLAKNSPEFEVINKMPTLSARVEAAKGLLDKNKQQIAAFYENPDNIVKMSDVFDGPHYQFIKEASKTGRVANEKTGATLVDRTIIRRAELIHRDLLEKQARVILPPKSPYLLAFQSKTPGRKLTDMPGIKKMGFKPGQENEAMEALLRDRDMTAKQAQEILDGLEEKVSFGKRKEQIKSLNTLQKHASDSFRKAIHKTIEDAGDVETAKAFEVYHELRPIVSIGDRTVAGGKTRDINLTRFYPSMLNSGKRRVLTIAGKLINRPEVRGTLRRGMGSFDTAMGAPSKNGIASILTKGTSFLGAKGYGKKLLQDRDSTEYFSRDSNEYFKDPSKVNGILEQVQDRDLTDTMIRQLDNNNKEGFANTLSAAANENPDLFDPAPYKSLVKGPNGESVITDKYEREQHRQWIEKTIVDPVEKYKHLKALNSSDAMLKAPYDVPKLPQQNDIRLGSPKGSSTVSRVASQLKQAETVDIGNDEERVDYDY